MKATQLLVSGLLFAGAATASPYTTPATTKTTSSSVLTTAVSTLFTHSLSSPTPSSPSASSSAAPSAVARNCSNLLQNGDFSQGLTGWTTASAGVALQTTDDTRVCLRQFSRSACASLVAVYGESFSQLSQPLPAPLPAGDYVLTFEYWAFQSESDAVVFDVAIGGLPHANWVFKPDNETIAQNAQPQLAFTVAAPVSGLTAFLTLESPDGGDGYVAVANVTVVPSYCS